MPSSLSVDLHERVIAANKAGSSRRQAAERFVVGKASAIHGHARLRDAGEVTTKPAGGDRPPPAIEDHAETIMGICRRHPQIVVHDLRHTLADQGIRTSTSGLWQFFGRGGITRK